MYAYNVSVLCFVVAVIWVIMCSCDLFTQLLHSDDAIYPVPINKTDYKVHGDNMGPNWACRPQMGPMFAPKPCYQGNPEWYEDNWPVSKYSIRDTAGIVYIFFEMGSSLGSVAFLLCKIISAPCHMIEGFSITSVLSYDWLSMSKYTCLLTAIIHTLCRSVGTICDIRTYY